MTITEQDIDRLVDAIPYAKGDSCFILAPSARDPDDYTRREPVRRALKAALDNLNAQQPFECYALYFRDGTHILVSDAGMDAWAAAVRTQGHTVLRGRFTPYGVQ